MFQFTDAQLAAWLAAVIYPFVRVAALIGTAPILGDSSVPRRVRVGLAIFATICIAPGVPGIPGATGSGLAAVPLISGEGFVLIGRQLLIGAAMGFSVRLAFAAIEYAGDLMGLQMGLGYATLVNPETNDQTPILGGLLKYFAMLAFLVANGPLMMLAGVSESFQTMPITGTAGAYDDWKMLVLEGGTIFGLALHLALPVVAALLVTNVALGVMTRAAPQLNVFSIGFPITITVGLVVLAVSVPVLLGMSDNAVNASVARFLR